MGSLQSAYEQVRDLAARFGKTTAILAVTLATAAFLPFRYDMAYEQWGWPYLLVVGAVAGVAGMIPAVIAAALSFLCWNFFFIPPHHTFVVAKSEDLLHILAFLLVAIAVGLQTGRLRTREAVAIREQARTSALYRLSSSLVADTTLEAMITMVESELCSASGIRSVSLDVGHLPGAANTCTGHEDQTVTMDLPTTGKNPARLTVRYDGPVEPAEREFITSVAHLVTAFLDNRHMTDTAMRAAAERETERLRNALVSSVSHELKTPLASLTASITDILDRDPAPGAAEIREVLGGATRDLKRLDRSIGDLLDTSRLEARAWRPQPEEFDVGEVVGMVLSDLPVNSRERIDFDIPSDTQCIYADFRQVARALRHVIDNALIYTAGRVLISAREPTDGVLGIAVTDFGPGIPERERQLVFEKFYRGSSGKASTSSTGLGLTLARELIEANAGSVHIQDVVPRGVTLLLELPARNGASRADGEKL